VCSSSRGRSRRVYLCMCAGVPSGEACSECGCAARFAQRLLRVEGGRLRVEGGGRGAEEEEEEEEEEEAAAAEAAEVWWVLLLWAVRWRVLLC